MPQISIIVPVYGAEKYLHRCLDSILAQTFTDWECILVDDGSKDRSGAICDEYAQKDSRFHVFHKENGGVSKARNTGIMNCSGEWCCFIDSDDWLEPEYLRYYFVPNYDEYGCILQGFFVDNEIIGKSKCHALPEKLINNAAELEYYLEYTDGVHNGYIWHRLFKIEIIRDKKILFPEGVSFAEDGIFFLNYIQYSEKFYITNKVGYHYIVRQGSLTSKGQKLDRALCYRLIKGIIIPTDAIVKKCKPNAEIVDGLKKYIWKLIIAWLFERSMNNKGDYFNNVAFVKTLQAQYFIDNNIDRSDILFKRIVTVVCSAPSLFNFMMLKALLCINRIIMQRLKSKFTSIKRRLVIKL